MTLLDESGPVPGGDDIVAAEYVVGVLAAEERGAVAARLERDAAFVRLVDAWEVRLAPMADAYPPVEPPADAKHGIDRRLFSAGAASTRGGATPASAGLWQSLAFWRGLTIAALALFAVAVAVPLLAPSGRTPAAQFVASLSADGSNVRYVAYYDEKAGDVALSHLSGEHGAGHDYELWAIAGKAKPVSLGVIPGGQNARITLSPDLRKTLASGVVIAISLEPQGGSPTGQPTGPVVAAGGLKKI